MRLCNRINKKADGEVWPYIVAFVIGIALLVVIYLIASKAGLAQVDLFKQLFG